MTQSQTVAGSTTAKWVDEQEGSVMEEWQLSQFRELCEP